MIVRTNGITTWRDKNDKIQTKNGTVFVHFGEECLKTYFPAFTYSKVRVEQETKNQLPDSAIDYLKSFGVTISD